MYLRSNARRREGALLPALRRAVMGTRMRFPGYPSNREADERTRTPLRAKAGEDKLFPVPLGLWEGVQVG